MPDDVLDTLRIREYESLRQESSDARQSQQAVLSWSLAAFAVIFGGLLAGLENRVPAWIVVLVFALAIPGLAVGAAFAWAGELLRMERAGMYLRGIERSLWRVAPEQQRNHMIRGEDLLDPVHYPVAWENYIWSSGSTEVGRKHVLAYIGPAALYGSIILVSQTIAVV